MDDDPEYFCNAFHMRHLPSEATMCQRMDEIGDSLQDTLRMANVGLFKEYGIEPSALANGYIPVHIDVSPFIDEKCNKELPEIAKTWREIFKPEIDEWIVDAVNNNTRTIYFESVQDVEMRIDYAARKSGVSVADFTDSMRKAGYKIPQHEFV